MKGQTFQRAAQAGAAADGVPTSPPVLRMLGALVSGNVVSQAVLVLSTPLVTRLYEPSQYGLYGTVLFGVSLLLHLCSMSLFMGIPAPRSGRQAANLTVLALAGGAVGGGASALIIGAIQLWTGLLVGPWSSVIWFLPPGIFAAVAFQTGVFVAVRRQAVRSLAAARVIQALIQAAVQLIAGLVRPAAAGLLAGVVIGQGVAIGVLGPTVAKTVKGFAWRTVRATLGRHRRYPMFLMTSMSVQVIASEAPTPLLASLASLGVAGHYALAVTCLRLPTTVVAQGIGEVFFSVAARLGASHQANRQLVALMAALQAVLGLVIFGFVLLNGPDLFGWVFGESWRDSGLLAQLLTPLLFTIFLITPLGMIALVHEREAGFLAFTGGISITAITVLSIGGTIMPAPGAVLSYSLVGAIGYLLFAQWLLQQAGVRLPAWWKTFGPMMAGGVMLLTALALAGPSLNPVARLLVDALVLCGFLSVSGLFLLKRYRHWQMHHLPDDGEGPGGG